MTEFKIGLSFTGSRLVTACLASAMLALAGCGGSSSSGSDNSPDEQTSKPLEAVSQAPFKIEGKGDAETGALAARKTAKQAIARKKAPSLPSAPGGAEIQPVAAQGGISGSCGGTLSARSVGDNGSRVTYDKYCIEGVDGGANIVIDGYVETSGTPGTSDYILYQNYTVTSDGETFTVRRSNSLNGEFYVLDSDGQSYRTYGATVSDPDSNNAFDVEARVCVGDEGCITYKAEGLIECEAPDVGFSGGTISITDEDDNEVVSVEFAGCSSYTVTYGGTGYTVNY